ncbi:MAG: methionyl-tRNA formyltransferase [Oscillospiraceae bacterium]|nr:methionyl-tRNA formyltransferase [Oscillospiraceae bacterium]
MPNYVIATTKSWNISNAEALVNSNITSNIFLITNKSDLKKEYLNSLKPEYIFFPHWSWIIPEEIYNNFNCVVFHMTDLPFGRGGSPLQNLIVRGIYNTKISAIKVTADLDAGPIYMKESVDISNGNAEQILKRVSCIIFQKMIPRFFNETLIAEDQIGEPVLFKRRTAEQSEIPIDLTEIQLYDYIRMLDGEGYPPAFIKNGDFKILFSDAEFKNGHIIAKAEFVKEK